MASEDDLRRIVGEEIEKRYGSIGISVWSTVINERGAANAMINQASAMSQAAADGVRDLPTAVWMKSITDETANVLLARAAGGPPAQALSAAAEVVTDPSAVAPAPAVAAPTAPVE